MYRYVVCAALALACFIGTAAHAQFSPPAMLSAAPVATGGGGNNTAIDGTPVTFNCGGCATPQNMFANFTTASAGDLICVVCLENGTFLSSVTDSAGTTFTKRKDQSTSGGACSGTLDCISFFSGTASGALSGDTITMNWNGQPLSPLA